MMRDETNHPLQWIPILSMLTGLILLWLRVDVNGIVLNACFLAYGCFKLFFYRSPDLSTLHRRLHFALSVVLILLTIKNLLSTPEYSILALIAAANFYLSSNVRKPAQVLASKRNAD